MTAPERDVVRIEEHRGPRGGRTLVLHLSCGCFLTRSSKLPPPKRARCIPCAVMMGTRVLGGPDPDRVLVVLERDELVLAYKLVDVYRDAVCERSDNDRERPLVERLLAKLRERAK